MLVFALQITSLPNIIARSRALHGMPITDRSLPSSATASLRGTAALPGHGHSTLVFDVRDEPPPLYQACPCDQRDDDP